MGLDAGNLEWRRSNLQKLYPGDSYVDWVGLSGYNWAGSPSTWRTFSQIFKLSLGYLSAITSKPVFIAETASNEAGGQ